MYYMNRLMNEFLFALISLSLIILIFFSCLIIHELERCIPIWGGVVDHFGQALWTILCKRCGPFWGGVVDHFGEALWAILGRRCGPFWGGVVDYFGEALRTIFVRHCNALFCLIKFGNFWKKTQRNKHSSKQ